MKANYFQLKQIKSTLGSLGTIKVSLIQASAIKRLMDDVNQGLNAYDSKRQELLRVYAVTEGDTTEQIKIDDNGNVVFKSDSDKSIFLEVLEKVQNTEIEINVQQLLPIGTFTNVGISAFELIILKDAIIGLDTSSDEIDISNLNDIKVGQAVTEPPAIIADTKIEETINNATGNESQDAKSLEEKELNS